MRTNPRQHILDTWRAFARETFSSGEWAWGGRYPSNSISDAEQILVLLYPATEVPGFRLDRPDAIEDDVLAVLKPMGSGLDIPMRMLEALEDYLARYADEEGRPTFGGGSYLLTEEPGAEVKPEQAEYDITESYSISVTLCLSAKGFLREFQRTVERRELQSRIDVAVTALDLRLTAAMVGLLRSFVVNVLSPDTPAEAVLLRTVSQGRAVGRTLTQDLRGQLQPVRDKLPELTFGLPPENEQILRDDPERFFECGWTWGVAQDAADIDLPAAEDVRQPQGVAESRPVLHFTVNALDGLADLFSIRTSRQGLLTPEQQPLREALNLRWGLALQYWSTIATFGSARWPIEDVPWQSTDGQSSPYFSELVVSIVALAQQGGGADGTIGRSVAVLEELGQRGLVSRRATDDDRGVLLHDPGVLMALRGSEEEGPPLARSYNGYAATLAKTALRVASVSTSRRNRARLIEVADTAVDHLLARRQQPDGLWDHPDNIFHRSDPAPSTPAWDMTHNVVEVFVAASSLVSAPPLADQGQVDQANAKIAEARHILDQERLTAPTAGGSLLQKLLREAEQSLNRADSLASKRPATAAALADKVLRDLDELAFARQAASRSA
ncbi:SCO2524 family protein [Catenulispora acidiphila]|uniref:SCO2524 family protein n=1 Tax=Catenulispora acidiphila TaxID=304895 RepID=UPI00019DEA79|nr:SCO2524 family protein [Catenulispora acidiphila]